MTNIKSPKILKNAISSMQRDEIAEHVITRPQIYNLFDKDIGRKSADIDPKYIDRKSLSAEIYNLLDAIVAENFSDTAIPSYFKWFQYSPRHGKPALPAHLDDNACTYTVDIQLRSSVKWPVWVNAEEFLCEDLDALLYYGVDQLHWRPKFTGHKYDDYVEVLIAHYAEPDHWYFGNPDDYPVHKADYHANYKKREKEMIEKYSHESMFYHPK